MLQCIAVYCSVLQCVPVLRSILQCVAGLSILMIDKSEFCTIFEKGGGVLNLPIHTIFFFIEMFHLFFFGKDNSYKKTGQ